MKRSVTRQRRWGVAAVEFAVVAPLFFVMVFGMVEYGRMVMVEQIMTNGAREGARVAILPSSTTSQVIGAVTTYLSSASIHGATVEVSPDPPSSATYGSLVTVTVTVPFRAVSWLPSPMFLGGTIMTANCAMRTEQPQSGG